jgi:hypothetical protein
MTIICCLPSLPVEIFGFEALFPSVISAHTLRLEIGRLNSLPPWVKSQAIHYALTRACFRAGKIRIANSSGSVERIIPFDEMDRKL